MSYAENIENYRRQLLTNANYQNTRWFVLGTPAKMAFRDKLLRFAKRGGVDHLTVYDETTGGECRLPGGMGVRRTALLREMGRTNVLMKPAKVFRKGYILDNELTSLSNRLRVLRAMPVEPIEALEVPNFQEAILIRNHNRGELHILNNEGTVKVIPWMSVADTPEEQFNQAWAPIVIEPVSMLGLPNLKMKPLFRPRRWPSRAETSPEPVPVSE